MGADSRVGITEQGGLTVIAVAAMVQVMQVFGIVGVHLRRRVRITVRDPAG